MASGDGRNIFVEDMRLFFQDNRDFTKLATYGLAFTGLFVAAYRSKNFTKFTKPLDVPAKFVKKNVPLRGVVKRIEPNSGPLLMVDHKSYIALPRLHKPNYLPIKLAGIDIAPNGINWLQVVVLGSEVTFFPLSREKEFLSCIVTMHQGNKVINVGEEITRVGFATLCGRSLEKSSSKRVLVYERSLHAAEKYAKHRRNGIWHFLIPPSILMKLQMFFKNVMNSFVRQ